MAQARGLDVLGSLQKPITTPMLSAALMKFVKKPTAPASTLRDNLEFSSAQWMEGISKGQFLSRLGQWPPASVQFTARSNHLWNHRKRYFWRCRQMHSTQQCMPPPLFPFFPWLFFPTITVCLRLPSLFKSTKARAFLSLFKWSTHPFFIAHQNME